MAIGRILTAAGLAALLLGATAATGAPPSKSTRIVSVRAVPVATQRGGGVLSRHKLNTVTASSVLGFRIKIRNSGSAATKNESVSLIIHRPTGTSILIARRLRTIGPNETKTLTLSNLGAVPFAMQTRLTVSLRTGATDTYPVIFSLPSGNFGGVPAPASRALIAIPDLLGAEQQSAIARLESLGLEVLIDEASSHGPVGRVVSQAPGAGARLSAGSVVKITVSKR